MQSSFKGADLEPPVAPQQVCVPHESDKNLFLLWQIYGFMVDIGGCILGPLLFNVS